MFSGILIPCDAYDRMSSGKFALFGVYNQITVNGRELTKDLNFYARIITEFEGKLDAKIRIYLRSDDANPHPVFDVGFSSALSVVRRTKAPTLYEIGYSLPGAKIVAGPGDDDIALDVVLSANSYEIARTTLGVTFAPEPRMQNRPRNADDMGMPP